ncbi:lipase family protein [Candidatus Phycosocius spiralis]|uniref:Fungal lipase-like domain-containing protein n=1 Tax=Candidatus Phycosocius spiralis TaxID=2815099 RepID=A0ABQ4PZP9_9PROT|nr:hypothetical protein [Candidatus Phycosocius spiralis]GIU68139.1 hypothetical protein PsB1_2293 [Candidatus Phycosocius spiralis]
MFAKMGASAAAAATAASYATAAAIGSTVSQAFGVATGIQEKFDWKAVALAAISGGVGGAVSSIAGPAQSMVGAAIRGAATNAISQGIAVTMGLQDKFSWAAVAAAGVGSAVGHGMRGAIGAKPLSGDGSSRDLGNIGKNLVVSGADAIAQAASLSLVNGTDFGDNIRASLPSVLGNVIGSAIAGGIAEATSPEGRVNRALNAPITEAEKQQVLAELSKAGGVGSLEWGGTNQEADIQLAVRNRLRMEQLATTKLGETSAFKQMYNDFKAGLAAMDTYGAVANEAILGKNLHRVEGNSPYLKGVNLTDKYGYKAHLYYDNENGNYIFANAGTDGPGNLDDVNTDKALLGNKPVKQLNTARDNAFSLFENGTPNLIFTGHSLGGALATVQALSVKLPGVTFDSAPFTKTMAKLYDVNLADGNGLMRNYYTKNDPLTWANKNPLKVAGLATAMNVASPGTAAPMMMMGVSPLNLMRLRPPPGQSIQLPAAPSWRDGHSMGWLLNGMATVAAGSR